MDTLSHVNVLDSSTREVNDKIHGEYLEKVFPDTSNQVMTFKNVIKSYLSQEQDTKGTSGLFKFKIMFRLLGTILYLCLEYKTYN